MKNIDLQIDRERCIRCGRCVRICPSGLFVDDAQQKRVSVVEPERCIGCGHCVAICPQEAIVHSLFPPKTVHAFTREALPSPEEVLLLCRARRSNRAFANRAVPRELLEQIVEAAHRAPTASNLQRVAFTVVTDTEQLRRISDFTIGVFGSALRKLNNPVLKPLLQRVVPHLYQAVPNLVRIEQTYAAGHDAILRGARAALLIHLPQGSRFADADANLAYQNASLMATSLGVNQFYMGFVMVAMAQERKGSLEAQLGISGRIHAAMALGMPQFEFQKYIDKNEADVHWM